MAEREEQVSKGRLAGVCQDRNRQITGHQEWSSPDWDAEIRDVIWRDNSVWWHYCDGGKWREPDAFILYAGLGPFFRQHLGKVLEEDLPIWRQVLPETLRYRNLQVWHYIVVMKEFFLWAAGILKEFIMIITFVMEWGSRSANRLFLSHHVAKWYIYSFNKKKKRFCSKWHFSFQQHCLMLRSQRVREHSQTPIRGFFWEKPSSSMEILCVSATSDSASLSPPSWAS